MAINKPVFALASILFLTMASVSPVRSQDQFESRRGIRHVLLVSIDGMHAVDYLNCSKGVAGVNSGQPYCPNLAELGETAVNYLDTSTYRPSDSFPLILVTHDESTFFQNDERKTCWSHQDSRPTPKPKGDGQSLMVSDFLTAEWGRLCDGDRCIILFFIFYALC